MPRITELLVHLVRIPRKFFSNARGKTTHIEAAIVDTQRLACVTR
jgi:hypothetical protein